LELVLSPILWYKFWTPAMAEGEQKKGFQENLPIIISAVGLLPNSWVVLRVTIAGLVAVLLVYRMFPKRATSGLLHLVVVSVVVMAMMLGPILSWIAISGWLRNSVNETLGDVALFGGVAIYLFVLFPMLVERVKPRLDKVRKWSEKDSDKKV
jgi:hypothetical protein